MSTQNAHPNDREIERVLKALANKRRLAILRFLKKSHEATVGDIAEEIKLSFKSTSRHLSVLSAADILQYDKRSLQVYYRIASSLSATARRIFDLL